jgi:hypothetical protein
LYANGRWAYDLSGMTYNWGPNDSWRPNSSMKYLGQLGDDIAIGYTLIVGGGLGSIASAGATMIAEGSEAVEQGTNVVYQGFDSQGVVRYVGITGRDAAVRFAEHANAFGTGRELLRYEVVEGATGLSRTAARVWEQTLINNYGLDNLLNQINSIAPKNWAQFGITP